MAKHIMAGVREYGEDEPVKLVLVKEYGFHTDKQVVAPGRLAIKAYNEAGNNYTEVDLLDVLRYLGLDLPEDRINRLIEELG